MKAQAGALELLDRCAEALRRLPGAVALLWLTALPVRFVLVRFLLALYTLGSDATGYRHALQRLANAYLCTWLLSLYGRQIFVRALLSRAGAGANEPKQTWRALVRVPLAPLSAHIYAAALIELLFWLFLPAYVISPFLLVSAGLAAAAAPQQPRDLLGPIAAVVRAMASGWTLLKLSLVGLLAFALAALNLHVLSGQIAWLAGGVAGLDAGALAGTLSLDNPLYVLLLLAGASLIVEPFWLGMLALQVDAGRSVRSGDDLRRRFADLVRARAA